MLGSLRISNVVLIDQLEIEFKTGLCALTGETGAGKSILLDSLGLAIGARAESGLVRKGADQANVTAIFEVPNDHIAKTILEDQGLEFDQTLMLRRSLGKDGRSRAFINDQPVSAGMLRQIGESVLEIHGQFDTRGLFDPKNHRILLDDYIGADNTLEELWTAYKTEQDKLTALRERADNAASEEEFLRGALEDLDTLEPQAGEDEKLAALRASLMHREQVLDGLNNAYHILNGEEDPVRAAWGAIDKIADKLGEQGAEVIGALSRASSEIQEAISAIQTLSADLEHSEHDLTSIDDRLFALRAQARKHGCNVDDLAAKREELAAALNQIEHADDLLAEQIKAVEKTRAAFKTEAEKLSAQRKESAEKLDSLVCAELAPLKLERARFVTQIETLEESEWGPHGIDRIRFLVATNPGAEPGPLNKIASGGEMSRLMLALKVVMAETGSADSLIFDEVDAGIGGGTADAVGERLMKLAQAKQILVVTHSPQVAARAANHWIVQKSGSDVVTTSVIPLGTPQERREEIARMLAGATISEEARAAADKLLETGRKTGKAA